VFVHQKPGSAPAAAAGLGPARRVRRDRPPAGRCLAVAFDSTVLTTRRRPASRRSAHRSALRRGGRRSSARSSRGRRSGARGSSQLGELLADHASDLWALLLATAGILLGLSLYGGAAGLVGSGVDTVLGVVVGWARFVLPPVCFAAGVGIIAGRPVEPFRLLAGTLLGLLAVCGLSALAGGDPPLAASTHRLAAAGGFLGVAIGRPLAVGVGTAGAVVVLVAVALLGMILCTGVSLRTIWQGAGGVAAAVGRGLAARWEERRGSHEDDEDDEGEEDEEGPNVRRAPDLRVLAGQEELSRAEEEGEEPAGQDGADEDTEDGADEDTEDGAGEGEELVPPAAGSGRSGRRPGAGRPTRRPTVGPAVGDWQLPPLRELVRSREQRFDERQLDLAGDALVDALAAHGVATRLVGRTVGPTVTRFELELGPGVKVARVTSLSRDIAYAMASPDVRILAPIPGKSAIGVEVPNRQRQLVCLGDILASAEARQATHPLDVALGRDIAGRAVMVNLAQMPHVLISGATGAGKSSCINSLITSVLMRSTPDQVRMILVDPKRVELGQYNGLPHLLTPVVVDPKKAANALAWAVKEMERRYDILAEYGMRDITGYNEALERGELGPVGGPSVRRQLAEVSARAKARAKANAYTDATADRGAVDGAGIEAADGLDEAEGDEVEIEAADGLDEAEGGPERLPFVLVVVDELNDLMMVAARDVEESVVRIAQMARAVGIHLVLATQRPSVDVITGVIKANVPSRMAFSVSSLADSRVILDQPGAERLIGKGDMLLLTASSNVPRRLQAPWVTEQEVRRIVAHWRRQGGTVEPVVGIDGVEDGSGPALGGGEDEDELLESAMELVVRSQLGSTSMLQRKLRVGFARAGRLMDLLERRGVVGPSEGSKARAVLMTPEELDSRSA
jgi:S-DNA-T family DNA segregation ATPase FtsK/SpoIIIE